MLSVCAECFDAMPEIDPVLVSLFAIAVPAFVVAAVALFLRNVVHCALLLSVAWVGVAAFYLWAGAEFAAFAQVLVYVGAVSVVALFAVMLTRQVEVEVEGGRRAALLRVGGSVGVASLVLAVVVPAIGAASFGGGVAGAPVLPVRRIGLLLMSGDYAVALLLTGVLLTAALLGAVVIASSEKAPEDARGDS
ncbi:MAG: NADH-quinone oxidoreductase subunit J [Puniceicoccales bacterium]|jgi:NADH:ubiquinone oxidoreductase subunit 6 (subunit J)|nr:NADH-quinone oxidoreductase subunit J [Puniceicoccales bacterium]